MKKTLFVIGLILLLASGAAWASPSFTVGSPTTSGSPFNNIKAVCGATTTTVTVSVDVTDVTFDGSGTCVKKPDNDKVLSTGGGAITVTANGYSLGNSGGNTWSGDIPVGGEGLNTVSVSVTATDNYGSTACSSGGNNASTSKGVSVKYVTDKEPPTVVVNNYSPGPVAPAIIPTIDAGEDMGVGVMIKDGSSGTPYSITLRAYGPSSLEADPVSDNFGGPSGPNDDGMDSSEHSKALALPTEVTTPGGIYTMVVEVNAKDLCGNDFETITKDPAKTHDGDSGNDITGTFEVLGPEGLEIVTHVISEYPNGDYGFEDCFTCIANKKKLNSTPGTIHLAALVTSTLPDGITNPVITLTLPEGFKFLLTGTSAPAHIFVGVPDGIIDFHYPVAFDEVTSSAGISGQDTRIMTVDLSNVDLGLDLGAGVFPNTYTIYVRAHAIYTGPGVPAADTIFTFTTAVEAEEGTATDDETVVGNPSATTGTCVDGVLYN